jgi:hypothetical protein
VSLVKMEVLRVPFCLADHGRHFWFRFEIEVLTAVEVSVVVFWAMKLWSFMWLPVFFRNFGNHIQYDIDTIHNTVNIL